MWSLLNKKLWYRLFPKNYELQLHWWLMTWVASFVERLLSYLIIVDELLLDHEKYMTKCCCYDNEHDAFMPVFCFYRHLSLFTCGHDYRVRHSLEDKRDLSLGELIASFFHTSIYYVLTYYFTLWYNSYAFSLLNCKVYHKRENAGSRDSGLKRSKTEADIFQTPNDLKISEELFWNICELLAKELPEEGPWQSHKLRWHPPRARHVSLWPHQPSSVAHLLLYNPIYPRKNQEKTFGMKRRCLETETGTGALLLSGGAIPPGKLPSGRGKSKLSSSPTFLSSWEDQSSSTSSPAPSHIKP
jgi:hypothetical protein